MPGLIAILDRKLYPGVEKNWDDEAFRQRVLAVIQPDQKMLDFGAGAGIVRQMNFKGLVAMVCGVDPDERVTENPYLDEGKVGLGESLPYPDNTFDIVIADNVLEHLANPMLVFSEVNRVLKPGGRFLFKTPNRWHYMPLIAQLTPTRFHKFFNKKRGRAFDDTFPTQYRVNSKGDIAKMAKQTGFTIGTIEMIEGRPEYLRFSVPTYIVGWLYERFVNSSCIFSFARVVLIGNLKKL